MGKGMRVRKIPECLDQGRSEVRLHVSFDLCQREMFETREYEINL